MEPDRGNPRYADTEGNAKIGVSAVTKLVSRDKVHVVQGEALSSVTLPTMAVTRRAKIPQLTAISGSPKVTGSGNKWIFRTQINQKYSGDLLADWAINRLKFTKIAILHANEPFGAGGANSFRDGLAKRNIKPVAFERFNRGDKDFSGSFGVSRCPGPGCWDFSDSTPKRPSPSSRPNSSA